MSPSRKPYASDHAIALLNARIAAGRPGCDDAACTALVIMLDDGIAQVLHIEGTPVTLLFLAGTGRFAILARSESDVEFSNDPWHWEGLTYRERPQ